MRKKTKPVAAILRDPEPPPAPAIRCSYSKLVDPRTLKPTPENPNKHPDEQLAIYAKILIYQGWRKAIVISKQSGFIVTGEGAWRTAMDRGWIQVPIDEQDFESPTVERAHVLADNRLPQLSELDAVLTDALEAKLREEIADLDLALIFDESPDEKTSLKNVEIKPPPKMAWVLIGLPLVRFGEINQHVEAIAAVPDTIVETTVNDHEPA